MPSYTSDKIVINKSAGPVWLRIIWPFNLRRTKQKPTPTEQIKVISPATDVAYSVVYYSNVIFTLITSFWEARADFFAIGYSYVFVSVKRSGYLGKAV